MEDWQADPAAGGRRWRRARVAVAVVALVAGAAFAAGQVLQDEDGAAQLTVDTGGDAPDTGTDAQVAGEEGGGVGAWRALPDAPMPSRSGHVAVWTGAEMLVWGGERQGQRLTDGGAYDPLTDTWRRLPPTPGVHAGQQPSTIAAVWTGRDMVVLGPASGRAYRPGDDTWRDLAPPPPGPWVPSSAAWTGEEVVVLADGQHRAVGYDPAADAWRELPEPPVAGDASAVGVELVGTFTVVGTLSSGPAIARYDPVGDAWGEAEPAPAALGGRGAAGGWSPSVTPDPVRGRVLVTGPVTGPDRDGRAPAVWSWSPGEGWGRVAELPRSVADRSVALTWTGDELLAWEGVSPAGSVAGLASAGAWREMAATPLSRRRGATAVWTGEELLVWGGQAGGVSAPGGAAFRPDAAAPHARRRPADESTPAGAWHRLPPSPLPGGGPPQVVWTGEEALVVDGLSLAAVAAYDPAGAVWRTGPRGPREQRRVADATVWTGSELVVITAYGGGPARPLDGVAYDPARRAWRDLASSPDQATGPVSAAWTGEEIVVLAGGEQPAAMSYEPDEDRWRALPAPQLAGQPTALASAGGEVLALSSGTRDNVARLDPEARSWRAGADSPVVPHPSGQVLAWTGSDWLVDGVPDDPGSTTTAAYDPATDRWRVVGYPSQRAGTAVATGWDAHPLLVVEPEGPRDGAPQAARLYETAADDWLALPSLPAWMASARTAVWTGEQLLVWSHTGDAAAFTPADP